MPGWWCDGGRQARSVAVRPVKIPLCTCNSEVAVLMHSHGCGNFRSKICRRNKMLTYGTFLRLALAAARSFSSQASSSPAGEIVDIAWIRPCIHKQSPSTKYRSTQIFTKHNHQLGPHRDVNHADVHGEVVGGAGRSGPVESRAQVGALGQDVAERRGGSDGRQRCRRDHLPRQGHGTQRRCAYIVQTKDHHLLCVCVCVCV